jgi:segregation and condensation protein B
MRLTQIIEALLFASESPLTAADLARVDERLDEDTVEAVIQELRAEYELNERSFQIYEVAGGFQLLTRPEFVTVLERYDSVPQPSRLSAPALEVLAIIAYRQPLGRAEVEDIRGVGSSSVLRTLQDRNLIEPVARGEGLGRPLLYGTTKKFLEHCGFRSLEDLPRPDELPVVLKDRTIMPHTPLETVGEPLAEPVVPAEMIVAIAEAAAALPDTPEPPLDGVAEDAAEAVDVVIEVPGTLDQDIVEETLDDDYAAATNAFSAVAVEPDSSDSDEDWVDDIIDDDDDDADDDADSEAEVLDEAAET